MSPPRLGSFCCDKLATKAVNTALAFELVGDDDPKLLTVGEPPSESGPLTHSTLIDKQGDAIFNPGAFSLSCFSIFFTAFLYSLPE